MALLLYYCMELTAEREIRTGLALLFSSKSFAPCPMRTSDFVPSFTSLSTHAPQEVIVVTAFIKLVQKESNSSLPSDSNQRIIC